MAIKEYQCPACWFKLERIEYSQGILPTCPRCEEETDKLIDMEKVISVPASAKFVGDGWTKPASYTKPVRGSE